MEERYKERDKSSTEEVNQEKQTNLDSEIKAGEWQSLRKFKVYRQRSRQGKIIATYQAIANRLQQLEKMYYQLVRDNPTKGGKLLSQIKHLRILQDVLLQCMAWQPAGELEEDMVPAEVWELIA